MCFGSSFAGGDPVDASLSAGRLVATGATVDPDPETEFGFVSFGQLEILRSTGHGKSDRRRALDCVSDGSIEPAIRDVPDGRRTGTPSR